MDTTPTLLALNQFQIVKAVSSDIPAIAHVLEEARQWIAAKGIAQWSPPFETGWIEQKVDAHEFHLVQGRDSCGLVAVFRLLWADPEFWPDAVFSEAVYLHTLAVRRVYAGQGVGPLILRWAESHAQANGKKYLRLDCMDGNVKLIAYYQNAGFIPCGVQQVGDWKSQLFQKAVVSTYQQANEVAISQSVPPKTV